MGLVVGVTGTASADHFFDPSRVTRRGDSYWIAAGGREFRVDCVAPVNGNKKTDALFDRALLDHADYQQFGGGGYNAAVEMRREAPDVEIRYSDSGTYNPELEADLASRKIGYRYRNLYPTVNNVVTGDPRARDKLIFKSAPPPHAIQLPPDDQFRWLTEGGTVLDNSDKHRAWVTKLAGAGARGRLNLHVVLTPALAGDYLMDAVIPSSRLIVAGLDELGAALGVAVQDSVEGGVEALRMLAQRALSPVVHLTLGEAGVLVSNPEDMTVLHVRLAAGKNREVRACLRDHSQVCGSGDRYAGAVTLHMVAGRSVLGAGALHGSPFASAAVAGCAAAVRRLGYEGPLGPGDFLVDVAGDLAGGAGAGWGHGAA
jgi:hypothetical protein